MKTSHIVIVTIIILLVGAGSFYAGMRWQRTQRSQFANFQGRTGGANGMFGQRNGVRGMGRPAAGQIIAVDDHNITVKMPDGSSKIVIFSPSTTITKSTAGAVEDLTVGQEVTAFGSTGADGSMTAQIISVGNAPFRMMQGGTAPSNGK